MAVRVIARKTGASGSVPGALSTRTMALVGTSRGKNTLVSNEAVTAGTGGTDTLTNTPVRKIVRVANVTGATQEVYVQDTDFTLSGDTLNWASAPALPAPELETPSVAASTGGTWDATGTKSFKITATDQGGTGQTTASAAVSIAITATGQTVSLQWSKVPFAGGYKIYLSTGGTYALLVTITSATTTTYTVTGDTTTATAPPSSNTSKRAPGSGSTYYVSYYYAAFSYTKKLYTNFGDLLTDHGVGSNLTNAAKIAFDYNGATQVYAVAVSGETVAAYQAAIDQLAAVRVNYIVPLKSGAAIEQYVKAHCEKYSGENYGLERYAFVAVASGSTVGDTSTAGTVLYWLNSFTNSERVLAVVPNKAAYYVNSWQGTDGNVIDGPYAVPHYFFAAAVAARACARPDPATPLTRDDVFGFTWPESVQTWVDEEVENIIDAAGGLYVRNESGQPVVYHGGTCNISTVEANELSVIDAEDELRYRLRTALNRFKGKDRKVTPTRMQAIARRVKSTLAALAKGEIILSFGDIEVTQDADITTRVWIKFAYTPIYPMNELIIDYSFDVAPVSAAA